MTIRQVLLGGAVAAITSLAAGSVSAATNLTGDTIHGYYEYPTQASTYLNLGTFTAPGGGNIFGEIAYNVGGAKVTMTSILTTSVFWTSASFNGFTFADVSRNPDITGVTLDAATTAPSVAISDATFTPDSVSFNFQGQTWGAGKGAVFDLTFGGVPEPTTWAMMLLGVGLIGGGLRMTRRKNEMAPTAA